ncbi:hypothetical protein ACP4OV_016624 [Aristida adscensionis]
MNKKKNDCPSAVSKLSSPPSPPSTITHHFQATETQPMQAVCHTPNSNHDNSASGAATPVTHPKSCLTEFMGTRPLTFSRAQELMRYSNLLHIGQKRKRKIITRASHQSPDSETELPVPEYISCYVKDRLIGKITCMVCGKEGHYTCDCPMKDQEEKVICTLCNKVGHCHLWCCRQNVSETRACCRCGEKGHYTNDDLRRFGKKYTPGNLSCSSCDTDHRPGRCPMGNVTCFLCEGKDHVPAQCLLSPMLTAVTQCHREVFQAVLKQARERSRTTDTLVKPRGEIEPYDQSHECQCKGSSEMAPKVSGDNHSEQANHDAESPIKRQVSASDKNKSATMKDEALASASNVTCFKCNDKGHYAYACPNGKKLPEELELYDVTCFKCNDKGHYANACTKRKLPRELELYDVTCFKFDGKDGKKKLSGELELCDVTCFNCHDKGHYSFTCPKSHGELKPRGNSHECQFKGNRDICYNCGDKGHYAKTCYKKVFRVTCFNCHESGHYSYMCPKRSFGKLVSYNDNHESQFKGNRNQYLRSQD